MQREALVDSEDSCETKVEVIEIDPEVTNQMMMSILERETCLRCKDKVSIPCINCPLMTPVRASQVQSNSRSRLCMHADI